MFHDAEAKPGMLLGLLDNLCRVTGLEMIISVVPSEDKLSYNATILNLKTKKFSKHLLCGTSYGVIILK